MEHSDEFLKLLGLRIMLLRKKHALKQTELAEKLDSGLAQIGRIERGEANFSIHLLMKMAETFGMTVSELVNINDSLTK